LVAYAILGLAVLVGAVLIARWFLNAEPRQVVRAVQWTLGVLAVLFVVLALLVGRQMLASVVLAVLLALALARARSLWNRITPGRGRSPGWSSPGRGSPGRGASGQSSEVVTRFLRMTLDHDSGEMDGVVLEGRHVGHRLSRLRLESLLDLYRDYQREDEESLSVLEAFLDRVFGDTWRRKAEASAGSGGTVPMSREEAYEVLGLQPGASVEEIRAAHRRLMHQAHPDHGGSNYLAAKINQAKDLLLGE